MGFEAPVAEQMYSAAGKDTPNTQERARLLAQISDFLLRHELPVSGEHLLHAHAIVSGEDSRLARLVSAQENSGERITSDFLELHARPMRKGEVGEMEQLQRLTAVLDRSLLQFGESSRDAQQAAADYGDELQRSVDAVAARQDMRAHPGDDMLGDIHRLTRSMLEKTRAMEARMKAGEDEAAELRHSLEKARAEASIDPLTGLPNRRAFAKVYEEQHKGSAQGGEPLALAICDIDFFKRVNDTHGHETGDRVIRAVGKSLDAISDECHVARHGGEEFVLLFCGHDIDSATKLLNDTREKLQRKRFVDRVTKRPIGEVTFSGGVTDALAYGDMSDAMRAADEALYRAKETGRNRIVKDEAAG